MRLTFGFGTWHLVDGRTPSMAPPPEPAISPTERFFPSSWSPTGGRIVGQVLTANGAVASASVYTLATRQFARVPEDVARGNSWIWPVWLADSRRVIVRRADGVAVVDADTE